MLAPLLTLLLACDPGPPPAAAPATPPSPPPPAAARPAAEVVHVDQVRARAMPPGSPNSATFMTLHNGGEAATALVAARAEVADTIELHTHVEVDGRMQMRPVPRIELPAGEAVVLQPGGLHVMLIGLRGPLAEGDSFPLTLVYEDGSEAALTVPVQAIEVGAPSSTAPSTAAPSTAAPSTAAPSTAAPSTAAPGHAAEHGAHGGG